jgi:hypothetical protein
MEIVVVLLLVTAVTCAVLGYNFVAGISRSPASPRALISAVLFALLIYFFYVVQVKSNKPVLTLIIAASVWIGVMVFACKQYWGDVDRIQSFYTKTLLVAITGFAILGYLAYRDPKTTAYTRYQFDVLTDSRKLFDCGKSAEEELSDEIKFMSSEMDFDVVNIGPCPETEWGKQYLAAHNSMIHRRINSYDASDPGWDAN